MSAEKNIKVLLVEDNLTDVKIIIRAFERAKFDCNFHKVSDGKEALDYIQNEGKFKDKDLYPTPDIILLDINMPRMDGHTFVRELKLLEEYRDIPIIVFTTKEGMQDMFKIEGVNDYIQKSIDASDLIARIKHYTEMDV